MGASISPPQLSPSVGNQLSQSQFVAHIEPEIIQGADQPYFKSQRLVNSDQTGKRSEAKALEDTKKMVCTTKVFRSAPKGRIKQLQSDSQYVGNKERLQPVQHYLEGNHHQMLHEERKHFRINPPNAVSYLDHIPGYPKQTHHFHDLTMSFGKKSPIKRTTQLLFLDPSHSDSSSSKLFKDYNQNYSIADSAYVGSSRIDKSSIMEGENDALQGFICLNPSEVIQDSPINQHPFPYAPSDGEEDQEQMSGNFLGHMPMTFGPGKGQMKTTESRVNSCEKMAKLQPSKRLIFDGDDTYVFISSPPKLGSVSTETVGKVGPVYYGENRLYEDLISTTKQTVCFDEHGLMSFKRAIQLSNMQQSLPVKGLKNEDKDGAGNKMVFSADANYTASLIPIIQVYYATHIFQNEETEKAKSNGMLSSSCCKISPAHLEMSLTKEKDGTIINGKTKGQKVHRKQAQDTGRRRPIRAPMKKRSRSNSRSGETNGGFYV